MTNDSLPGEASGMLAETSMRAPLHVAFVSQYFHPEQFSNNAIVETLVQRGHSVDVVTGVPNYGYDRFYDGYSNQQRREELWRGARIHRARTVARGKGKLGLLLNYLTFPLTGTITALHRIRRRADVSFVSMPSPPFQVLPAVVMNWLRGTPVVYWVQDVWPESAIHVLNLRNRAVIAVLSWVSGWIYRRADLVLVQSAVFPPMIARFGVPADQIRVLPNTAPPMYRPIAAAEAPAAQALMPAAAFRLMFAGNIGEAQDFDTLLRAAKLLLDHTGLHWVILGSGRELEPVRARCAELGLAGCFHLLGRQPEDSMPGFFAQADALIVSLKANEIFSRTVPYKVQCYLACGRPIIASLEGEGARIVQAAGAGLAAGPSDPEALAAAILRMMQMPAAERAAMGASGRAFFDAHYAEARVYGDLEDWLFEAAALRPGRGR